jgi:hypothetical protein
VIAVATTPQLTGYVRVDISLDWNRPGHYESRELACRICKQPTQLRDELGDPAHKVCVESDIEARVLAFAKSLLPVPAEPVRRPARPQRAGQQRVVRGLRTAVAS